MKDTFRKKSFLRRMFMPLPEVEQYFRDLRKYQYEHNEKIKGIKIRKKVHKFTVLLLKINRMFMRQSLTIVGDERINTDKAKIYAVTHVGRYDFENAIEAINDNAFFFMGDPNEVYKSVEYILIMLVGAIFVDTWDKTDRHISKETMVKVLEQGGNVQIYPEGAWNLTSNQVVMPLYTGAVEAAIRARADIIPVAVEWYGKDYFVNIGKNIDCSHMKLDDKREEGKKLRDIMCTLKWEIWEKHGIEKRSDVPANYEHIFIDNIMKDSDNGYTIEEIERTRYHDRNVTTPEEVFAFMKRLEPNRRNAFLWKR